MGNIQLDLKLSKWNTILDLPVIHELLAPVIRLIELIEVVWLVLDEVVLLLEVLYVLVLDEVVLGSKDIASVAVCIVTRLELSHKILFAVAKR
jgi:hypothetical protein